MSMTLKSNATEDVHLCILCGSDSHQHDPQFYSLLALREPYGVRRCDKCDLRWLSPRPSSDGYRELYSDQLYFGGQMSPESYSEIAEERLHHFKERIKKIEAHFHGRRVLDILDVGAATGDFVHLALKRGHRGKGVELSEDARNAALQKYGIQLDAGTLSQYVDGSFDVIHMNHVLEHMPNPFDTLASCSQLLREDGLLVTEVPQQFFNDLDRIKRLFFLSAEPKFNSYSLHHTYFFSPKSISRLMEKTGFDVLSLRTAVGSRTPLWPLSIKNTVLRIFLMMSDITHGGGNIIEVFAKKVKGV